VFHKLAQPYRNAGREVNEAAASKNLCKTSKKQKLENI
jgi:hypothetical protein